MSIPGVCGKYTYEKQITFGKLIEHHLNIVKQIYDRKNGQWSMYLYFDTFAGSGFVVDNDYDGCGSPLIFHRIASISDVEYKMVVAEINEKYRNRLLELLTDEDAPFEMRNNALDCCPKFLHKWSYGIAYIDPPMTPETFEIIPQIISDFVKYCPQVDVVLYISAGFMKRFSSVAHVNFDKKIAEYLHLDKDWIVRRPIGRGQYTFLIGTKLFDDLNWPVWRSEGFYKISDPEGWRILKRLNYKENEPKSDTFMMKQEALF